jgi:hypothetical protein
MEKTLRELIVDTLGNKNIIIEEQTVTERLDRWDEHEGQMLPNCAKELTDSILSLLSARIKAKALTDEQIKDATDFDALCCDGCYKITEKMTTAEADVYCLNCTLKAVAAAQLQAVLGELE